jgi:hypothetical protein
VHEQLQLKTWNPNGDGETDVVDSDKDQYASIFGNLKGGEGAEGFRLFLVIGGSSFI